MPTTLDDCHQIIRDLREENDTLRKSGEDFGRLAERVMLALRRARSDSRLPRVIPGGRIPVLRRTGEDSVRAMLT